MLRIPKILNKNRYISMSEKFGLALLNSSPSDALVANNAVIVREVTEKTILKYETFFETKFTYFYYFNSLLMGGLKALGSSLSVKKRKVASFKNKSDVIFISHLTTKSQLFNPDDPYFGNLPALVTRNGWKNTVLYVNHSGETFAEDDALTNEPLQQRGILPNGPDFLQGIKIMLELLSEFFGHLKNAKKHEIPEEKRYFQLLAKTQIDNTSVMTLHTAKSILEACEKLQPRTVIFTFEGYSWERLTCKKLRSKFPKLKIIGYNHSVITRGPRAINHKFTEGLNPDHVFCAGELLQRYIVSEGDFSLEETTVVGSPKSKKTILAQHQSAFLGTACVLAAPEGNLYETKLLASALIGLAEKMPEVNCVLRLHPLIRVENFKKLGMYFRKPPKNFNISTNSLEVDLERAGWVIYRGSSVVFEAIAAGVRPLFFDGNHTGIGDVVLSDIEWRKRCYTVTDLMDQINFDIRNHCEIKQKEEYAIQQAKRFASSYFSEPAFDKAIAYISDIL